MKAVKNREVARAWENKEEAVSHTRNFRTDGFKLWSYELLIGDTCAETGARVLRDYTAKGRWGFKSQTTSCHVGLARLSATVID